MRQIELNGKLLDLEQSNISLTFAANRIGELESRTGISSEQFELTLTSTNAGAFDFAYIFGSTDGSIDNKTKIEGKILQDNQPVSKGFFQIAKHSLEGETISLNFFSGNSDWVGLIKDKSIRDVNLDRYAHSWTEGNIIRSFKHTEGYIYPLIDYGRLGASNDNAVTVQDFYPAVFCHTLFRQIFSDVGVTLEGSFLDDNYFTNTVIPFSSDNFTPNPERFPNTRSVVKLATQTKGNNQKIEFSEALEGGANIDLVNNRYTNTSSLPVTINIKGGLRFESVDLGGGVLPSNLLNLNINGGFDRVLISSPTFVSPSQFFSFDVEVFLEPSDYVEFFVHVQTLVDNTATVLSSDNFTIEFGDPFEFTEGGLIYPQDTLPDISQEDFVKFFVTTFGLVTTYDNYSKTLSLFPFRDVVDNKGNAIDWTDKVETKDGIEIDVQELTEKYGKVNNYIFLSNDDQAQYEGQYGKTLGSGSFEIASDFVQGTNQFYESPFGGTINERYTVTSSPDAYIPKITILEEDDDGNWTIEKDAGARILLVRPNTDIVDIDGSQIEFPLAGAVTTVCAAWFHKRQQNIARAVNDWTNQLSFDYPYAGDTYGKIIKDFYWQDYERIINEGKIWKGYFRLGIADIVNLDFSKPIFIDGYGYFYLDRIEDYDAQEQAHLCYLVKI